MTYTGIKFHIRIKTDSDLNDLVRIIEPALNLQFTRALKDEEDESVEGNILGLKVSLSFNIKDKSDTRRACQFAGIPDYSIAETNFESLLDISNYLMHFLNNACNEKWYIPSKDEIKNDLL